LRPAPTGVADGVEVEVRFNPDRVDQWRLLSQETRDPAAKSAPSAVAPRGSATGARMEAGQSVTALYELIPARSATAPAGSNDLLQLQVGYRPPSEADRQPPPSRSLRVDVPDVRRSADAATADYKFAAAVVGYGLLLRDSPYKGDLTWDKVLTLAEEGQGPDPEGYRAEFLSLVRRARSLQGAGPGAERPAAPIKSRP
jgi:Ca-activated chloride channel family protein